MTSRIDSKVLSNAVTTANHHFFPQPCQNRALSCSLHGDRVRMRTCFFSRHLVGAAVEQCCSDGRTSAKLHKGNSVGTSFRNFSKAVFGLCGSYAYPEFAYAIVNLPCVRAPIAENQAWPRR
jgi:hypothetical protein